LPTIEHGETAFDDGPWTIRVIPPVAFTRAVLDDCDEQVDAAFQPQLLPDRPAVSDVGTAETQVEPVVVEDDAAAWAFQPTMHLSREPGPARACMGRQRPSTLQEFVDGMRLPITGALPAQKGELSGSWCTLYVTRRMRRSH
jgi:hypothetical protein